MVTRSAPYHHADGSNCWTRDCRRRRKNGTVAGSVSVLSHSERIAAILAGAKPTPPPSKPKFPVFSGRIVNGHYQFKTTLEGGYDPDLHTVPKNSAEETNWVKPFGGLWLATADKDGVDSWTQHVGEDFKSNTKRETVKFKDSARVIIINSREDYINLLDAYPHYADMEPVSAEEAEMWHGGVHSIINTDGTVRRNLNYEKLSDDYDAVLVTWKGLSANRGRNNQSHNSSMGSDVSLDMWELESVFVLRKEAVEVVR